LQVFHDISEEKFIKRVIILKQEVPLVTKLKPIPPRSTNLTYKTGHAEQE